MNWFVKRLGQSVFTIFTIVTATFALIRFMPGGPADYIRAQLSQRSNVDPAALDRLVSTYINIDRSEPIYVQYIDYLTATAKGDLGQSMYYNDPVTEILLGALPWTVFVMSVALVFSFIIAIVLGAMMAYVEGSGFDVSMSLSSTVMSSVPYYIAAILLLILFSYQIDLFPAGGRYGSGIEPGLSIPFFVSALEHAALPILSYVLTVTGGFALAMRGNSIQVLGEDYLRVARLRGISRNRIVTRYVTRNAILPLYTTFMIAVGNVFGGSIILETIFNYSGIGYYIYTATMARDYPLLMGGFIVITIAVVASLLVADLTYGKLDPRVATGGDQRESY